jgi:hypothetical protein
MVGLLTVVEGSSGAAGSTHLGGNLAGQWCEEPELQPGASVADEQFVP